MSPENRLKVIAQVRQNIKSNKRTNILDVLSDLEIVNDNPAQMEEIMYELEHDEGVLRRNWELYIDPKYKPKTFCGKIYDSNKWRFWLLIITILLTIAGIVLRWLKII